MRIRQQTGRINFSQFEGSVKSIYTRNVSAHLQPLISVPRYIGTDAFHHALTKFGIEKVFADPKSKLLLGMASLTNEFIKVSEFAPVFDRLMSSETYDANRFELLKALHTIFGSKHVKVILSRDNPDIYFLKEDTNLTLFKRIGSLDVNNDEKVSSEASCPDPKTLTRMLRGNLGVKRSIDIHDHVRTCEDCGDKLFEMQKLPKLIKPKIEP